MTHRLVLRQLPEDEARYNRQLETANSRQLALAKFFQKMAFYHSRGDVEIEKPAPIYLQQAITLTTSYNFEIEIEALLRGRK